jgi:hypothetical protein
MNEQELWNAVDRYYSLKEQYDQRIADEKRELRGKIEKNQGKNNKNKNKNNIHLQCINCNSPFGSTFKTILVGDGERQGQGQGDDDDDDDEKDRHLVAYCNDKTNPCLLDIDINLGHVSYLPYEINLYERLIRKYKKRIIIDKNDLIFGYIKDFEAIKLFEEIQDDIESLTNIYDFFSNVYKNVTEKPENNEYMKQMTFYNNVKEYNVFIDEYKKTQNKQVVVEAIQFYINTLIPSIEALNNSLLSCRFVEKVDDKSIYVKQKTTIKEKEIDFFTNKKIGVIKFVVGQKKNNKKKKDNKKDKDNNKKKLVVAEPDIEDVVELVKNSDDDIDWSDSGDESDN